MPAITVSDMSTMTKKIYNEGVVSQLIEEAPLFKSKRKKTVALGTDYTSAIQTGWAQGIGNRADGQALPTPGKPTFLNPTWDLVNGYVVLGITGQAWERVKGDARAFIMLNKKLIKDAFTAYARDYEFSLFGSATGIRGLTSGAITSGASKTFTLLTTGSYANSNGRGFFEDMIVEFWNNTTGTKITEARVNDVSASAGTFTVDNLPADVADGSYIYRKGNRNLEVNGLTNLVNDSTGPATVLGIASTTSKWQSKVYGNSGTARDLTFDLLDKAYLASQESNGKPPSEIWMDYNQMRLFVNLHNRNLQYQGNDNGNVVVMNGHTKVVEYGAAKVKLSSMAPAGIIFMLQADDLEVREQVSFDWIKEENASNIWQKKDGYHEFEATAWHMSQFILESRRIHSQIQDLTKS